MFGYILAHKELLSPQEQLRYRSCYCGLCAAMGQICGQVSRLSLSYDMTFLVLLLNSLEEPEEHSGTLRCGVHPMKPQPFWKSAITDYCAILNVALSHYKCLDDWQDDRNFGKLLLSKPFAVGWKTACQRHPRQAQSILQCLQQLSKLEQEKVYDIDQTSNVFATLMGELFVFDTHHFFAPQLRQLGESLGRFVYLLDAICDLPQDRKKQRFNPLLHWQGGNENPRSYQDFLSLHLGEATQAFDQLPLVLDVEILQNILYQGVWTNYHLAVQRFEKSTKKGGQPHD